MSSLAELDAMADRVYDQITNGNIRDGVGLMTHPDHTRSEVAKLTLMVNERFVLNQVRSVTMVSASLIRYIEAREQSES